MLKQNMPNRILLAASLFLCALVAGCPNAGNGGAAKAPRKVAYPVETEVVQGRTLDYTISAVGSVEAFEVVQVTARVAGTIDQVLFKEGQNVLANQVLVEIEPARFKLEVDAAKAVERRAETSYKDVKWGLDKRKEAQAKSPTVFSDEEIKTWEARTAVSLAEWEEEKVNLERAELNQQYSKPTTPVAGIVDTRRVSTGQYVQAGTVIATLIRRDPMMVRFAVPERDASALSVGQKCTFRVSNVNVPVDANIIHVSATAEGASRLVAVTAEVDPKLSAAVRPGSFAEVTVTVKSRTNAPTVPETSVRPSAEGFLAFVVEEGVAKKRVLQIGLRTADGRIEVLEGIKPGETLVTRGGEALSDGVNVQISGGPKPEAGQ